MPSWLPLEIMSNSPQQVEPVAARISCVVCSKTFTRQDHLNRHEKIHINGTIFSCSICRKGYTRSDTLKRHQATHLSDDNPSNKLTSTHHASTHLHACIECANARVKCSGGDTCKRCAMRNLECRYRPKRKRKDLSPKIGAYHDSNERSTTSGESIVEPSLCSDQMEHEIEMSSLFNNTSEARVLDNSDFSGANSEQIVEAQMTDYQVVDARTESSSTGLASHTRTEMPQLSPGEIESDSSQYGLPPPIDDAYGNPSNISTVNWLPTLDYAYIDWTDQYYWDFEQYSLGNQDRAQDQIYVPQQAEGASQHLECNSLPSLALTPAQNDTNQETTRQTGNDVTMSVYTPSTTESASSHSHGPKYYVDGGGARLPSSLRHKQDCESPSNRYSSEILTHANGSQDEAWISESRYNNLTSLIQQFSFSAQIKSAISKFPALADMNHCIQTYFSKFHMNLPLLHISTYRNSSHALLLDLAVSAIGATLLGTSEGTELSQHLHKLFHMVYECEKILGSRNLFNDESQSQNSIDLIQARILNIIGLFHSGDRNLRKLACESHSSLVALCLKLGLLDFDHYDNTAFHDDDSLWSEWLSGELRCRAAYFIWFLDARMAFESEFRPIMELADAKSPLPCPEKVWDAPSPNIKFLKSPTEKPPTLGQVIETLYIEKRLLPNVGELATLLVIHGTYRRVWEVKRYHEQTLSDWTPTALVGSCLNNTSKKHMNLTLNPVVSRWINGTCDCLDVLHWTANTSVMQRSGFEHPTILQLHLSRLILLTPVVRIRELVRLLIDQTIVEKEDTLRSNTGESEQECRKVILMWLLEDQYKARLAVIHAASVFWYSRRWNCQAIIEPFADYLASLVLWAYSKFFPATLSPILQQQRRTGSNEGHGSATADLTEAAEASKSADIDPAVIQIDRPCDDELVQTFVKSGNEMITLMAGVGDIRRPRAPPKILREGIKLLQNSPNMMIEEDDTSQTAEWSMAWGDALNYVKILTALMEKEDRVLSR